MYLTINGEHREVDGEDLTVIQLLDALDLGRRRVAVEVNQQIIRRAIHDDHRVCDGDEVEIVHFVGGG